MVIFISINIRGKQFLSLFYDIDLYVIHGKIYIIFIQL